MITFKNIRNYLSAHKNMLLDKFEKLPEHKKEQVAYRAEICKDCIMSNKCISDCGCDPKKLILSEEACKGERWGDMLDAPGWEVYKVDNGVVIELPVK